MKRRTLRITLLSVLVSLTLLTVTAVGLSGWWNTHRTARDLTEQLLEQTSARVDRRIIELVNTGERQAIVFQHLFKSGLLSPDDPGRLAAYWYELVEAIPVVNGMFYVRESDGQTLAVVEPPNDDPTTIRELIPEPGGLRQWTYTHDAFSVRADGGPRVAAARLAGLASAPAGPLLVASVPSPGSPSELLKYDMRQQPGYQAAKKAGRPAWSETYFFLDDRGEPSYPGVSHVTPLYGPDGKLEGVLGVNFNLYLLCDYFKKLDVTKNGFAFLIEQQEDGSRHLMAHPDRDEVFHETPDPGGGMHVELTEIARVKDRRVAAFLDRVPRDARPAGPDVLTPVRFEVDGVAYLGGFCGLEGEGAAPAWMICLVVPEDDVLGGAKLNAKITVGIGVGVLLLALLLSYLTAGQVARPLEKLAREAEAIGRLEIDPDPEPHSFILEVDRLAVATEDMKASLRSFRKYVPAELVAQLLRTGREAALGGQERRLTISFSDIADFTTISESLPPEKLVEHLGEYLQAMSEEIAATGGTVDKYIGDAIMAFWGAPSPREDHALAACTAALRHQRALAVLREKWRAEGRPEFRSRIGIHTGEAVVGNIGSLARFNYTVIGDAVNLASRLEGLNKFYGTSILITESTFAEAKAVVARPLDWVSVKGKNAAVLVYELLALKSEAGTEMEEFAERYSRALQSYRAQRWAEAIERFEALLRDRPDDAPAAEMLRRCRAYRAEPPGADWDGVHRMHEK